MRHIRNVRDGARDEGAGLQTTKNDFASVDGVARGVVMRVACNHGSNAVRSAGQGCWKHP